MAGEAEVERRLSMAKSNHVGDRHLNLRLSPVQAALKFNAISTKQKGGGLFAAEWTSDGMREIQCSGLTFQNVGVQCLPKTFVISDFLFADDESLFVKRHKKVLNVPFAVCVSRHAVVAGVAHHPPVSPFRLCPSSPK